MITGAPTTTSIIVFAVWLSWKCLSLTPVAMKNGTLALIFPTLQVLEQVMLSSHFTFAPGLLDVLQSKSPPTIAYFKSLPLHLVKLWAVYLLVLEKANHRPKIYIGCGTECRSGVSTRMSQYGREVNLPKYVRRALDDGYVISHKGLLCWAPLPTASKKIPLRALFLIVEAVFTLYFWAMVSRKKDYTMPPLCPWSLDSLEYDGCCGHFSLSEKIDGQVAYLTPEQIDAVDSDRKLQNSRRDAKKRGPVKTSISSKKRRENALAQKKFSCDLCNVFFGAKNQLRNHKLTQKHIDNVDGVIRTVKNPRSKARMAENFAAGKYHCSTCNYTASTQQKLNNHLKTPKHRNQVNLAQSSLELD